jgi:hypothetical protein
LLNADEGLLVVLVPAAAAMAAGYASDVAGLSIHPWLLAAAAIGAMLPALGRLRPGAVTATSCAVCAAVIACGILIAPEGLPVTIGPDVVHHLQLIHVISATWRLPHDAAQYPFLLEMMHYTPGSHILAAAIAAWVGVDPLRVVYPIALCSAAIKAGLLYELTRHLLGGTRRATVQALGAPLLACVPHYFLGSFVEFFFFAQVVSETFAIGTLLALVAWQTGHERRHLFIASACAAGVVLSWPIWIVPTAAAAGVAAVLASPRWREQLAAVAIVLAPAALLGAVHQVLHRGAASIVTSAGAVTVPSVATVGPGLLVPAAAGVIVTAREWVARPVVVFLAATLALSAALALLAHGGPGGYYMAFKMVYLAILPAAVLGAAALARAADAVAARLPRPATIAAFLPVLVASALLRGHVPLHRVQGSLSIPARDVGLWARASVPPACVDYFSRYWLTGYWLHLDVLGNPRLSDRMTHETFDFPDVAAKWIEGRGLPYAIVEDMAAIPREIRPDMEPLHQRGSFVLVRNRRAAACPY